MEGDNASYSVRGFNPEQLLPNEDVYTPKKVLPKKKNGLEVFMDKE